MFQWYYSYTILTVLQAPSRKERLETEKTTARIKADQDVSLQRSHGTYTATKFWGKVQL